MGDEEIALASPGNIYDIRKDLELFRYAFTFRHASRWKEAKDKIPYFRWQLIELGARNLVCACVTVTQVVWTARLTGFHVHVSNYCECSARGPFYRFFELLEF